MKKQMTKEEYKKLFQKELVRSMNVIRGSWQKVVNFSAQQKKIKVWEELP